MGFSGLIPFLMQQAQQQSPQGMGAPQQGGMPGQGIMPPTNPVQPTTQPSTQTDPLSQQALQGMQTGQGAFSEQLQRQHNLASTVGDLIQQQQQLKTSPESKISRILSVLPGFGGAYQGAKYGPARREYTQKAQQIDELQKQQQIEEQPVGAAASLGTRPFTGYGSYLRGEASMANSQTQRIAEQHKNAVQMRANQIREQLGAGKLTQEAARTQMMDIIQRERDATMTDIAGMTTDRELSKEQQAMAEEDFKTESDHILQTMFGWAPSKPITPAAPARKSAEAPKGATQNGATHIFVPGKGLQAVPHPEGMSPTANH